MHRLLFLCVICAATVARSQTIDVAWESSIAANYSVKDWKFNTSVGHRKIRLSDAGEANNRLAFLEANQFITRKLSTRLSVSFGYKYRQLNPSSSGKDNEQRLTQQLAFVHLHERVRLMSRARAEQRFRSSELIQRYRYRFSLDTPLSGQKLDIREFYLLAASEWLVEIADEDHTLDTRLTVGLGYVASSRYKFQLDFTQRMENLEGNVTQIPFITTSAILNF